jgi:hypothetical protein
MNGGILFAPVIKVFNGGNDTTDDSNDSLRTGDGNIPPKKEMIFKKESIQEDKKPEKSTVDSILDFTKSLIVKKMP